MDADTEDKMQDIDENESKTAGGGAENKSGRFIVGALFGLVVWYFVGGSAVSLELYNCGEPISLKKCDTDGSFIDCIFTNKSSAQQYTQNFTPWLYDSDGISVGRALPPANIRVPPGRSVHFKFTPNNSKASVGVFCSIDPDSPYLSKKNWRKVE